MLETPLEDYIKKDISNKNKIKKLKYFRKYVFYRDNFFTNYPTGKATEKDGTCAWSIFVSEHVYGN